VKVLLKEAGGSTTASAEAAGFVDLLAPAVTLATGDPELRQVTSAVKRFFKGRTKRLHLKLRLNDDGARLLRESPSGTLRVIVRVMLEDRSGHRGVKSLVTVVRRRR
jgi:hypothetical protein